MTPTLLDQVLAIAIGITILNKEDEFQSIYGKVEIHSDTDDEYYYVCDGIKYLRKDVKQILLGE